MYNFLSFIFKIYSSIDLLYLNWNKFIVLMNVDVNIIKLVCFYENYCVMLIYYNFYWIVFDKNIINYYFKYNM